MSDNDKSLEDFFAKKAKGKKQKGKSKFTTSDAITKQVGSSQKETDSKSKDQSSKKASGVTPTPSNPVRTLTCFNGISNRQPLIYLTNMPGIMSSNCYQPSRGVFCSAFVERRLNLGSFFLFKLKFLFYLLNRNEILLLPFSRVIAVHKLKHYASVTPAGPTNFKEIKIHN